MPKLCSQCKFYSDSNEPTQCPKCNVPLQFTLLGAPGAQPEPMAGVERPPQRAASSWDSFTLFDKIQEHWMAISLFGIPILIGIVVLLGIAGGGGGHAFDQLEIGMSADEVENIVSPNFARRRTSTRMPFVSHPDQEIHLNNEMVLTFRDYILVEKRWVGKPRK